MQRDFQRRNTMTKQTTKQTIVEFNPDDVKSLKDLGYRHARTDDTLAGMALYAMDHIAGFPESISDTDKTELVDGYRLRFNELNPPKEYAVIDGNYLDVRGLAEIPAKAEKVILGVDVAFSYTQQQFGRLKEDNPSLHAVIKVWRDKANDYTNNKLRKLANKAKEILNKDKKRERGAVLDFNQRVIKALETLTDNCRTAQSRGDDTANAERFREAKIAFLAKWNHG
jgi:hypothetical protein